MSTFRIREYELKIERSHLYSSYILCPETLQFSELSSRDAGGGTTATPLSYSLPRSSPTFT